MKCIQSESFFIVGYERSTTGFKSLLLGAYRGNQVVYVGSVGTGFKQREAAQLRSMMDKLPWKKKAPPVLYSETRDIARIQPTVIAEIEYRGWTSDEKLRHSSYKGLRGGITTRSAGTPMTSLAVLQQAITAHATRAAEKLRRHGLVAAHMTVFFHTNPHNGSVRDSSSRTAKLSPPSNTTMVLVKTQALKGRRRQTARRSAILLAKLSYRLNT